MTLILLVLRGAVAVISVADDENCPLKGKVIISVYISLTELSVFMRWDSEPRAASYRDRMIFMTFFSANGCLMFILPRFPVLLFKVRHIA